MAKHLPCTVRSFRNARLLRNRRIFLSTPIPGKQHPVDPASVIQAGKLLCLHRLYPESRDFRITQSRRRKAFHRSFPVEIRHSSLELHLPIDRRRRDLHLRSPLPPWQATLHRCHLAVAHQRRMDEIPSIEAWWRTHKRKRPSVHIRLVKLSGIWRRECARTHIQASCPDPFGNNRHPMLGCIYRT